MNWLVVGLAVATVLEGALCAGVWAKPSAARMALSVLSVVLLLGCSVALCIVSWEVWIWTLPVVLYRSINLGRVYVSRLPEPHLRTVTLRAFTWLVLGYGLINFTTWFVVHFSHKMALLNVLAIAQLLSAIILLRASMHTWRHAAVLGDATPLSDKELPSLSVLIPARNETEDLKRCLEAITASNYPKLEIVVLDDCSVNRRTPEIIRGFAHDGVRFVQGGVPDESRWLAKNYAYEQLSKKASGELLLFCGVDARLAPHSIRELVCLLEARKKDMLSVMPLRDAADSQGNAILQSMRYYWEICLPRRLFKRPPVLSTCWLIRKSALERIGGFESVSRSVNPEAPIARGAVVTDAYSFIRSDDKLGIYSDKSSEEQYATSVRMRYPQLHRRLELVALATLFELIFLLGPLVGLCCLGLLDHISAYAALWGVTLLGLITTYALVVDGARLSNPWYGWLLFPVAVVGDIFIMNVSLWKYEFGSVDWKGRNVCVPVMQVIPRLPKA